MTISSLFRRSSPFILFISLLRNVDIKEVKLDNPATYDVVSYVDNQSGILV